MIAAYSKKPLTAGSKITLKLNKRRLSKQKRSMNSMKPRHKKNKSSKMRENLLNNNLFPKKEFFLKLIMHLSKQKRFSMLYV